MDQEAALVHMAGHNTHNGTDADGLTFVHILRRMSKGLKSISRHTLQLQGPEQKPCPSLPEDLRYRPVNWSLPCRFIGF